MRHNSLIKIFVFLMFTGSSAFGQTIVCPEVEINNNIVNIRGEPSNGRVYIFFEEGFFNTEISIATNDSTFSQSLNTINDLGYAFHLELGDSETVDRISLSINGCNSVDLLIKDKKHEILSINLIDNVLHVGYYDKLPAYE